MANDPTTPESKPVADAHQSTKPLDREPFNRNQRADTFRARLNAPISVIIEDSEGNRVTIGTANLRDLSLRGALISDLRLPPGVKLDTAASYTLKFRLMAGPLTGMEADCQAVRYDASIGGFGVRIPDGFRIPLI